MYKEFISSDLIQKSLVDSLRKGQTILPAVECLNMIDDHLLNISDMEHAGRVMLDFVKTPKKFTFCRYPLLLCCLICEFSNKCKARFPVYESFFQQVYNAFSTSGHLFVDKIRKDAVLEYHLNQKDLRNRTCLQIMSQNRLYLMLEDANVAAIIGKYWSGTTQQFGLIEFSSFNHLLSDSKNMDKFFKFENFGAQANQQSTFFFNYYSYRDIASIRYYFNKIWVVVMVALYMAMIYFAVQDKSLAFTKSKNYGFLPYICQYGVYLLILNKVNSLIYFLFVDKWWSEIDNNLLDISLFLSTVYHFNDFSSYIIEDTDTESKEISDSISLSIILIVIWFKLLNSLFCFKILGGFIRTMLYCGGR